MNHIPNATGLPYRWARGVLAGRSAAYFKTLLKLFLGLAIFGWLIRSGRLNLALLSGALREWPELLLFFVTLYSIVALTSCRWSILLKAKGFPIGLRESFTLNMIGLLWGLPTPGGAGGDVARIYLVGGRTKGKAMDATSTVIVDRIAGLVSFMGIAGVAALWNYRVILSTPALLRVYLVVFAVACGGLIVFAVAISAAARITTQSHSFALWQSITSKSREAAEAIAAYRKMPAVLLRVTALSLAANAEICASFALLFHMIGSKPISSALLFTAIPLALMSASIPLTPASIGVGQVAFFTLFQMAGGRGSEAASAYTLYQCTYALISLSGFLFYLRYRRPQHKLAGHEIVTSA